MNTFNLGDEVGNRHVNYIGKIIEKVGDNLVEIKCYDGVNRIYDLRYLIKTPHQELLDLGWEKISDCEYEHKFTENFRSRVYLDKDINAISLKHIGSSGEEITMHITLQLAKLLVRYMEEL